MPITTWILSCLTKTVAQKKTRTDVLQDTLQQIQRNDPKLIHLNLKGIGLNDADVQQICNALLTRPKTAITSIDLSYNPALSNQCIEHLVVLPLLQLDLSGTTIDAVGVNLLLTSATLTNLIIRQNRLKTLDPQRFQTNTTLHTLDASGNQLSGAGVAAITASTSLRTVNLSANGLQSKDINNIVNAPWSHVTVRMNQLGDTDIQMIANTQPQWQSFNISYNALTAHGAQQIIDALPKAQLDLRGNNLQYIESLSSVHSNVLIHSEPEAETTYTFDDNAGFDGSFRLNTYG